MKFLCDGRRVVTAGMVEGRSGLCWFLAHLPQLRVWGPSMGCGMSRSSGLLKPGNHCWECRPSGYELVVGGQQDGTEWAHSGLCDVIL